MHESIYLEPQQSIQYFKNKPKSSPTSLRQTPSKQVIKLSIPSPKGYPRKLIVGTNSPNLCPTIRTQSHFSIGIFSKW